MAETLKFGNGQFATKKGSTLAYNSENGNFKPLPFTFDRSTSATRVNKEGLIEVVSNNEPRIDFSNDSKGALLLEPSRSNLITYSQDISDASWNKVNSAGSTLPIVTADYGISPDGTQNADRIQVSRASGAGDFSSVYKSITTSSVNRALSVWLKSLNGTPTILIANNNGVYVSQQITTEWVRYELDLGVGTLTELQLSVVGSNFVQGVSESADFLAWGAQLEQGSYATSYIPTQGSSGTRVAESCEQTVPDGIIEQTEGSVYFEIKPTSTLPTYTQRIVTLYEDASNLFNFQLGSSNDLTFVSVKSGESAVVITKSIPALDLNSFNKIACSISTNNFVFYVNGIKVGEDISVGKSMPLVSNITFANYNDTTPFVGNVKDLRVYNQALTDAELQQLTS